MTHRTILATLLLASGAATCAAQGNNPAFEARQAARAAESKLDWQISVAAYTFRKFTFFETVDKVAELGLDRIEGFSFQKISREIPAALDPLTMSDEQFEKVLRQAPRVASDTDRAVLRAISSRRGHVSNGV